MFLMSPLVLPTLEDNIVHTVNVLMKSLKVKVSSTSIKAKLTEHPDYPSLLSISDSLASWKIPSLSFKPEKETLLNLPTPFIVHMRSGNDTFFSVVTKADSEKLIIADDLRIQREIDWNSFTSTWTNVVTVVEVTNHSGDEQYEQNSKKERFQTASFWAGIVTLALVLVFVSISTITANGWFAWTGIAMLLCKTFGVYVATLLVWYEFDKNNLALQKICKAGNKRNCNAVLQSPLSKVFAGISWSEIGLIYFIGGWTYFVYSSLRLNAVAMMGTLSLFTAPYVIFSLIYQWKVIKQWCPLCVTVQIIFLTEIAVGLLGNLYTADSIRTISISQGFAALLIFIGLMSLWLLVKPVIYSSGETIKHKLALTRLKNNTQIFESQLYRQRAIANAGNTLGFTFGNPGAANKLVKVCNPYCGPCARIHPQIHELLEFLPNLQVQIIFAVTSAENDERAQPVRLFYAIQQEYGNDVLDKALMDWYSAKEKNYTAFALQYPVKQDLEKYDVNIDQMSSWCNLNKITYTPTIFINGFELPEMYSVGDLKYLLN
jgi:thiol-disulfide isomerase/thioredoxin